MKKFLLRIGIGIVALLILAALGVSLFLDGAIKRGVETLGPNLLKVNFSLKGTGKAMTVTIPEIRLADLGTGPEGITAGQLTEQVLTEIARDAAKASAGGLGDLNKTVNDITKNLGSGAAGGSASNLTKGIGDLFKKK